MVLANTEYITNCNLIYAKDRMFTGMGQGKQNQTGLIIYVSIILVLFVIFLIYVYIRDKYYNEDNKFANIDDAYVVFVDAERAWSQVLKKKIQKKM